jgi:hypothetical protein
MPTDHRDNRRPFRPGLPFACPDHEFPKPTISSVVAEIQALEDGKVLLGEIIEAISYRGSERRDGEYYLNLPLDKADAWKQRYDAIFPPK